MPTAFTYHSAVANCASRSRTSACCRGTPPAPRALWWEQGRHLVWDRLAHAGLEILVCWTVEDKCRVTLTCGGSNGRSGRPEPERCEQLESNLLVLVQHVVMCRRVAPSEQLHCRCPAGMHGGKLLQIVHPVLQDNLCQEVVSTRCLSRWRCAVTQRVLHRQAKGSEGLRRCVTVPQRTKRPFCATEMRRGGWNHARMRRLGRGKSHALGTAGHPKWAPASALRVAAVRKGRERCGMITSLGASRGSETFPGMGTGRSGLTTVPWHMLPSADCSTHC